MNLELTILFNIKSFQTLTFCYLILIIFFSPLSKIVCYIRKINEKSRITQNRSPKASPILNLNVLGIQKKLEFLIVKCILVLHINFLCIPRTLYLHDRSSTSIRIILNLNFNFILLHSNFIEICPIWGLPKSIIK